MSKLSSLVLQRMRTPMIVLILAYAISVLGLVLIPGVDDQGRAYRMDFFQALYFVSYMSTTIGFGELPYPFTPAQRLWTMFTIYLAVVSWLYALGAILTLVRNPGLRRAVEERKFARRVRRITEPFYLVCGYGETARLLIRALQSRRLRAVAIDQAAARIDELALDALPIDVPGLFADARESVALVQGGLLNSLCAGVAALTSVDSVNLKVAITCKLLNPKLTVVCRADSHDSEANMRSFGTDHIINPFDSFAERLAMALRSPGLYLVHDWLTGVPGSPLGELVEPRRGRWVLCGYGRFGKAVHDHLGRQQVRSVIIEADPVRTGSPADAIVGRGTEADTLRAAGIDEAVGVVAGTDDDTNNLSIIFTAQELNPALFTVARQNRGSNADLFEAANVDLVMDRSDIIAHRILALITTPLLAEFFAALDNYDEPAINELVSRLAAVLDEVVPDIWTVVVGAEQAPAVIDALDSGRDVGLSDLGRNPHGAGSLHCFPLLLRDRKSTRLNSSHTDISRMPSSA